MSKGRGTASSSLPRGKENLATVKDKPKARYSYYILSSSTHFRSACGFYLLWRSGSGFHSVADPDATFHFDADPDLAF
jgi:hypothetical protein